MRFDRQTFVGVGLAGVVGAALLPFAVYFVGLALAPPPPIPAVTPVPAVIANALWARAEGGQATAFTPMTPVSIAQFVACIAYEDWKDTTPGDARRVTACRGHMPAVQGVEYLSGVHMRDADLKPSFREGLGRLSTTIWLTHSWTKAEFLNTLAERGEFGGRFRGLEAAAQGYFGRPAAELTLGQAAMLAAFIGDRRVDPWCDPTAAANMRRRILERMRDDMVIDDAAVQVANASALGLVHPPADHQPCRD